MLSADHWAVSSCFVSLLLHPYQWRPGRSARDGQTIVMKNDIAATPKLIKGHSRKILTDIQDYDYGGANSKHDPRRRPGIGGRSR
ncbi:Os01g0705400 [Oryza sativa Japonica Group]|uniref:Os01g0705400 protein n=1 Tax=Oryza sativa subsp. japonica TaxID=39947 RepID=C7IXG1_ORYSJ|nr:Os01g0705400 [Oryza sativa Japonica Group]|eukprot:NP_001172528.1 Os01g0705400 [Oryza sativa Japonica Group]